MLIIEHYIDYVFKIILYSMNNINGYVIEHHMMYQKGIKSQKDV